MKKYLRANKFCLFFQPCFQIRKKDTPIRKYKIVQTGPKSQLGGEKKGLLRVAYHVGMALMVNGVPARPTNSQRIMEAMSLGRCFMD